MKTRVQASSVLLIALVFILLPAFSHADSSPALPQSQSAAVLLHGPETPSSGSLPPGLANGAANNDFPEPTRQAPLLILARSPSGKRIVLWQASKPLAVADSKTSDPATPLPQGAPSETAVEETGLPEKPVPDPLEPVNRIFFKFNDKLYFWVLKPAATGYKAVLSEDWRVCIRNFFSNVTTPIRLANCLLQGQFKGAGNEVFRFGLNTTFGFFGFFDQAKDKFDVEKQDRDTGQTFGIWGFSPVIYIEWPLLGPSDVRDTFGFVGDVLLDPRTYLLNIYESVGVRAGEIVNSTSLSIGDYEALKKAALDPYIATRDAYLQYRQNKIKKK